jgi:arylsulfatase A-like enzyme
MLRDRNGWLAKSGSVLAAWVLLLAVENLIVGLAWRDLFAGSWEMGAARTRVSPIALGALLPLALVAPLTGALLLRAGEDGLARRAVATLAAAVGALEGYGVSFGRHFASWGARAPFVAATSAAAALVAWVLAPRAAKVARTNPRRLAAIGAACAVLAWCADAFVLPRLYPAFHAGLLAITLGASALVALAWHRRKAERAVATAALVVAAFSLAWAPRAAARLRSADNLRMVLYEHAPVLGRAVRIAAWLSPPGDLGPADAREAWPRETGRALDWTNKDVLLVSIDALRADHVGAYGYARPTTPSLDRLAREGAVFDAAYCPTPHTSYSVTSMMTGKYMRPLLALGMGEDSETWASYARRYGYKTAAFYPPAVFFIDEGRFTQMRDRGFDFEYRKVEFATPELRKLQLAAYLARADPASPLFVWVHLFEPHEPYVMHEEHRVASGAGDLDAYDSEIAAADAGLGALVDAMRAARPGAVVIVTADHGEEFGEHGGRYHGTTVYEEQVRVPLVVVGPGVARKRIPTAVQTIDLLPTVLSALGVPPPARVRGRDLGALLAGTAAPDQGLAFAETDDYTLVAKGDERLVCARRAAACALYDARADPKETRDLSNARPDAARALRAEARALERDAARYETGEGADLPEALRRGLQGEADAADDVAALLDDAKVAIRRRAARVSFALHAKSTVPQLARALGRDEDEEVRRYCALALVRAGEKPAPLAEALVKDEDEAWRRRAALAFAEQGDGRGAGELVVWWSSGKLAFEDARTLLAAIAKVKPQGAASILARGLSDVRLGADVADTLGALGDPRARAPLLEAFAQERYVTTRWHQARALVRLGARGEIEAPLARFAGMPAPSPEAMAIAKDAGLLVASHGGWSSDDDGSPRAIDVTLRAPRGPARLLVLVSDASSATRATVDGAPIDLAAEGALRHGDARDAPSASARVHVEDASGVRAIWLVARTEEPPPPPPEVGEP